MPLSIVEGYTDELAGKVIKMAGSVQTWKEKNCYKNWMREELEKDNIVYESSKGSCLVNAMRDINKGWRWERTDELNRCFCTILLAEAMVALTMTLQSWRNWNIFALCP